MPRKKQWDSTSSQESSSSSSQSSSAQPLKEMICKNCVFARDIQVEYLTECTVLLPPFVGLIRSRMVMKKDKCHLFKSKE
jgi:hypothetical protein